MSLGIQLFTDSGRLYFDTATQTWNYIGSFIVPANESAVVNMPVLSVMSEVLIQRSGVDVSPTSQEGLIHAASSSGTTVSASGGNIRTLITVLGR